MCLEPCNEAHSNHRGKAVASSTPKLESISSFNFFIVVKRTTRCFQLETWLLCEAHLAPLHRGLLVVNNDPMSGWRTCAPGERCPSFLPFDASNKPTRGRTRVFPERTR